ncbi:MAG: hypothetical protein JWR85_1890 [Marmoricola sp.]|nr:hypothetical protein [Marmoricola sp.]
MTGDPSYEQAVSAWADHLRSGGTTPWSAWQPEPRDLLDTSVRHPVPDAIHLELVRRINLAAHAATADDAAPAGGLADRVFATAAPGRGLLDVPLPWPGLARRFGTPALDPSLVPDEELVRLAVGVLAHLLPGVPRPAQEQLPSPWPLPWRRRFRLHGSPATVAAVRRSLLAQGHVETDWRPTHVVIARPVEVMMAERWSAAVRNGGILKWSTTGRRAQAAGRLPDPIDVTATAARLQGRRREPLHVVVARDADRAAALAAGVLRARPAEIRSGGDAALSDLLRRLNRLTALTSGPNRVRDVARTLVSLLEADAVRAGFTGFPVTPPASLAWAREVAATGAEELRHAGYAVHGDPDALAPTDHDLPGIVDREHTLELAVTACLRTWHLGGDP